MPDLAVCVRLSLHCSAPEITVQPPSSFSTVSPVLRSRVDAVGTAPGAFSVANCPSALATSAESAKALAADAQARADAKSDGAQTAEAEIKRLKDELAKANAELERIRKRLAQPASKPPA